MAESVNDDRAGREHVVKDTRPQPERPPLLTVFTRLAHFSPQTKRWHNVRAAKPKTSDD
jgi:hypothetical protein